MVWRYDRSDRDRRRAGWARSSHHSRRRRCVGHTARSAPNAGWAVALDTGAKEGRCYPSEDPRVFRAHEGPHVIYRDGPTWAWLKQRGLLGVTCRVPVGAIARFRFWHQGRLQRVPPKGFLRALRISRRPDVPVDQSFRSWASRLVGEEAAGMGASASGVGVFHHDPGALSAAFVAERLARVYSIPAPASYRQGSWGAMFEEIGAYARKLGVIIELGSRVTFHWCWDHHCRDRAGVSPGAAGR